MLDFLNRPYPFSFQPPRRIKQVVPIGLFVFFFLVLFKPFGLENDPDYIQTSAYLSFSGILIGLLTTVLIPFFLPSYFNESKWTLKRNFIWNCWIFFIFSTLMFLSFNAYSIYHFHNNSNFTFSNYIWWVYLQIIFGVPLGIIINLANQYYLLKKYTETADIINSSFKSSADQKFQNGLAERTGISSDAEEENKLSDRLNNNQDQSAAHLEFEVDRFKKISIEIKSIIYIEAFGNYINVVFVENGMKKITVRETISNIEQKMNGIKELYRTHRSYLVNLKKIEKIEGDSQGLKLYLKFTDKVIPVSRNKIKEFRILITSNS